MNRPVYLYMDKLWGGCLVNFTSRLERDRDPEYEVNNQSGLYPFAGNPRKSMPSGLPFRFKDYLELIDWTGRAIVEHKRGYIPGNQPPILERSFKGGCLICPL